MALPFLLPWPGGVPLVESKKAGLSERFSAQREICGVFVTEKYHNPQNGGEGERGYAHPPQPLNPKSKLSRPDGPASDQREAKVTAVATPGPDTHHPGDPFLKGAPVRPVDLPRTAFRTLWSHFRQCFSYRLVDEKEEPENAPAADAAAVAVTAVTDPTMAMVTADTPAADAPAAPAIPAAAPTPAPAPATALPAGHPLAMRVTELAFRTSEAPSTADGTATGLPVN